MNFINKKYAFTLGLCGLAFFVVALRLYVLFHTHFIADDALITYRYAENLVQGHGLVYNFGERVLGTTTPLLTLFISFLYYFGVSPIYSSPFINIFSDSIVAILIVCFFDWHFKNKGFGFLAGFLFAVFPAVCVWSTSGMESSLYMLLIFLSIFLFLRKQYPWAFFTTACALLTRIDAVVLIVALVLTIWLSRAKIGWKPWAVLILTLFPWLVISTLYYGSPVPNSLLAKKVFYSQLTEFQSQPLDIIYSFIFGGKTSLVSAFYSIFYDVGFLILFLFAILGVTKIFLGNRQLWILPLWLGGYVAFFVLGKTHMHPWYFVPFYGLYLTVVAVGMSWVWESFFSLLKNKSTSLLLQKALVSSFIAFSLFGVRFEMVTLVHLLREYQRAEDFLIDIALWVKQNTSKEDKVYYSDIGKLGYFSERYILDSVGIISPITTKHYRKGEWLGPIKEVKPELVLFSNTDFRLPSFLEDKELSQSYQEIKRFDLKKETLRANLVYSQETSGLEFPVIIVYRKRA